MAIKWSDVEGVFARYSRAIALGGIRPRREGRLTLLQGSPSDGTSHKVVWLDANDGGQYPAPGTLDGHIGWSKRDAYERLYVLSLAFEDMAFAVTNGMEW